MLDAGTSTAGWVTLAILVGGSALSAVLWRAGGAYDHTPNLDRWLNEGGEAFDSPPVLARLRHPEPAR